MIGAINWRIDGHRSNKAAARAVFRIPRGFAAARKDQVVILTVARVGQIPAALVAFDFVGLHVTSHHLV